MIYHNWKDNADEYIIHIDKEVYAYTRSDADEMPRIQKFKISFVDK